QGFVVPRIIGAYTDHATASLAMHVPDPRLWIEAGVGMPGHAKERCLWALQQLHNKGILHGHIQLHHFIITSD
ncbi:uncharacterized protein PHACADRAFT_61563, partial [Phanerochaete carnosa HHB-10118-sp]